MLQYNFTTELSADEDLNPSMRNKKTSASTPANPKSKSSKVNSTIPKPKSHVAAPSVSRTTSVDESISQAADWCNLREPQVVKFLQELSHLEELLLKSPRVPLTGKAMVAEDEIINHLDFIRSRLPATIDAAQSIVNEQEMILATAEQYAQQQITAAQQQAFQISNELGIVDRAKAEASQIHQGVMAECATARDQVRQEAEQSRRQQSQEIEHIRQQALAEAQAIRRGADEYADRVLAAIDEQLGEIQAKVRRGRQHLNSSIS
jgi:hypothetical protein